MMANTWLLIGAFIPFMFFWILLKVQRIRLYTYKRKNYKDEYDKFGYQAMGIAFIRDIMKNRHTQDKRYTVLLKNCRLVLSITVIIFMMTIYTVYLFIK